MDPTDPPTADLETVVDGVDRARSVDAQRALDTVKARLLGLHRDPVRLGRYTLLDRLGAGGMGVVYRAFDPELDRQVAIKLIRHAGSEDAAAEFSERLRREARALAKLQHPNVIHVYDVGTAGNDVYVAMELVDGADLGTWMRERQRPVREILSILIAAGKGLAAAHAAGLVHRDFKPANVLVGKDGRVRVLDFGLARESRIDSHDAPSPEAVDPVMTTAGSTLGTPAYMSPEQHDGKTVDARSDQYCFFVTLWEALAGERPFLGNDIEEIRRAKLNERPTSPRIPTWLSKILRRGLSPTPEDRYSSMEVVLALLKRDPARRLRRIGAAGVSVAVVGGAMGLLWMQKAELESRCRGGDADLEAAWNEDRKQQVSEAFRSSGLGYADESSARVIAALDDYAARWRAQQRDACEDTHVRGTQSEGRLDLRMACLRDREALLGSLVDVLETADADVVEHAMDAVTSLDPVEDCEDERVIARMQHQADDPELAAERERIAPELSRSRALHAAGRYARAAEIAGSLLETIDAERVPALAARVQLVRGFSLESAGDLDGCKAALTAAFLAATRADDGATAARAATQLLRITGALEENQQWGNHWAEVADALLSRPDASKLTRALWLGEVGIIEQLRGDYTGVLDKQQRALALVQEIRGPDHYLTSVMWDRVALAQNDLGMHDEALESSKESVRIRENHFGPTHPRVAKAYANHALSLHHAGRTEEAAETMERALAIFSKVAGDDHADTIKILINLAVLRTELGQYETAIEDLERALSASERTLGPGHPSVSLALGNLANAYEGLGQPETAAEYSRRAIEVLSAVYGPDNARVGVFVNNLGGNLLAMGKYAEAASTYARALAIFAESPPPGYFPLDQAKARHARALRLSGEADRALAAIEATAEALDEDIAPELRLLVEFERGAALVASGRDEEGGRKVIEGIAAEASLNDDEDLREDVEQWRKEHR